MTKPLALVLRGDGINCDAETVHGLELAGFDARAEHVSTFIEDQKHLRQAKLLALPGGFSFGDEIASGKVLALKLRERVMDSLYQFVGQKGLVIGICNGFQVLTQLGLLPRSQAQSKRIVTLTKNSHGHFNDRWVDMTVQSSGGKSYFSDLTQIELPIRHGEGRLVVGDPAFESEVKKTAPLRYINDVNGSFDRIAALTDADGRVLGLMPHPEAFVRWTQHPLWTTVKLSRPELARAEHPMDLPPEHRPHGFTILRNAFEMVN
ncbi:MAG: phosphoribosylformylglycinamidine synthase subunit PurQ [Cyanobacteria bacterium SZAS LIN-2]|nr:phosphoribosylformylglycinamidine synthase subunit PurQ [Cyanobacteria bacterium SZAS LIN-2]MBS2007925.1 phosphoribosylformylglycinamidine synthase subunit PurQ [Cyanobacteria bacterium SZAS TMP-1]